MIYPTNLRFDVRQFFESRIMKVSVAVCGRFHFHNYIDRLDELGILDTFYYSHKARSSGTALTNGRAVNIWAKEYAVRFHAKVLKARLSNQLFPAYHDLWQLGVRLRWRPTPLLHVMAHGTSRHIVANAKREGSIVIGEVVNTHPLYRDRLLSAEEDKRGLPRVERINRQQRRLIEEVEMYDYILAPSSIVRDSFIQHGVPDSIIKVIPYAANVTRFHPLEERGRDTNRFNILCVGQISLRKGQLYLLEAVKQLNDRHLHVTLIGQIDSTIESLLSPYRHLFTHIPRVDNAQLNSYYNAADLFVLPSLEEGLAVVLCEALATGLPIVATRESGAAEIIEHERSGKIVPSGCVEALAKAIIEMASSPERTMEFSRQASIAATGSHNWAQYVDKLQRLYTDCLS
ncbi:glycosyltransferase family 4 protein [Burkholderia vietnamiensis]|uniref:glycosyltransferase family 4 protein n=2 Tax=Burkholderiaceae TaxID=119060 RepID=UPI00055557E1|nr:glycosyltransferase family 4 protein [Burkholderia vietnamiensis]MBR7911889.1 glycosyltransferase family 4 protein [Burkholderia vietnamiensis]MCA7987157.1 glycosyltransferase family 4 protein [Burkholderia vietnamiensis]HDR9277111.1 glycosyltransferase family 4 protein [Burkholderia vietnamiensis]